MELDALAITLDLLESDNGTFYKQIDGFIYTFKRDKASLTVCVNLPQINASEKETVAKYIEDTVLYLKSVSFSKNGIIIAFVNEIFDDTEYIEAFTKAFSSFLSKEELDFSNTELDIAFNKDMFVYTTIAREIESDLKKPAEKKDFNSYISLFKSSTQIKLITAFVLSSTIYGLLNIWCINVSAVMGYVMGWISAQILLKAFSNKKIYVASMVLTAVALSFATLFSLLYLFLSQMELYTFVEFATKSLTVMHCLFNMALALILALFGVYSTVPSSKKKTKKEIEIEDF